MFRTYDYIKDNKPDSIEAVYRVRGLGNLDELINKLCSQEGVKFPCVAVDVGFEGKLNLHDRQLDESYLSFHILFNIDDPTDIESIDNKTYEAYVIGRKLINQIRRDKQEIGFNGSDIHYSSFGPRGNQTYGVTFNFVFENAFGS